MQVAENVTSLPLARPQTEQFRLAALQRYHILDSGPDAEIDFLTTLAAQLCGMPLACVALVDSERVWFKSAYGVPTHALQRDDSYCALAVLGDAVTEIADVQQDYRTAGMSWSVQAPQVRHYCAAALCSPDGYPIGTLAVLSDQPGQLSAAQRATLQQLARQVMALLDRNAAQQALERVLQERELLATTDELTGLHNRRSLLQKLTFEVARARRFRSHLSTLMLELDQLAELRASYGPAAAEQLLASVGKLLRDSVRVIDVPSRYNESQFCILLPNTPPEGARILANNLCLKIAAQTHTLAQRAYTLSASVGVAALDFMEINDGPALLAQAERVLTEDRAAHAVQLPLHG